jgi:hypothetical protein
MAKSIAVFSLCLIVSHAIQMAFHEVSFSSIEYTLLMFALGLSQAYRNQTSNDADTIKEPVAPRRVETRNAWST